MTEPQLVATAWTSAGDASPRRIPSTSPVPIAERVAAVADAGYVGMGLIAADLLVIRDSIGFAGLRDMIADHGLAHFEIELIERWWIPRGERGHTYDVRDLLFEAAEVLSPTFIKIGSELGPRTTHPESLIAPLRELAEAGSRPRDANSHRNDAVLDHRHRSDGSRTSSRLPIIPRSGCWWMPGTCSGPAPRWRNCRDSLTPEMIFGVELDDAADKVVGTLFEDTVERRLLCGEGCFDLHGFVDLLRNRGFDGPWGVEILSSSFRTLPVREALAMAAGSARKLL